MYKQILAKIETLSCNKKTLLMKELDLDLNCRNKLF